MQAVKAAQPTVMPDLIGHPPSFQPPRMERDPAVYIVASGFHGTIYTGVTSNLLQRVYQHREESLSGFTAR
jgi:hypothetical protein